MSAPAVRVLVIDDSPLCTEVLRDVIEGDPRMGVVGVGHDGLRAVELAAQLRPTVITMDLHMPRMNGLDAVERIMAARPTRILLVTEDDARGLPFEALRRGAADVVRRPHPREGWGSSERDDLRRRIVALAQTPMRLLRRSTEVATAPIAIAPATPSSAATHPSAATPSLASPTSIVGVAASTGGPAALAALLSALPATFEAPIVVVQHLAAGFTESFARWLDRASPLRVRIARDGAPLAAGDVWIAPEDAHVTVDRARLLHLDRSAPLEGHRPAATRLFASLASSFGPRAAGVVLTGMGRDGAAGLLALRHAGGATFAQDEASSVVFGMPRAARDAGAALELVPLERMASRLTSLVRRQVAS